MGEFFCPVCGSSSKKAFSSDYAEVRSCEDGVCGHLFASNPAPNAGVHEHDSQNIEIFRRRNEAFVAKLLDSGLIKDCSRVLDIGAGLGHIVSELRTQAPNVKVTCVEAAPMAVRHLKQIGFDVFEDFGDINPDSAGYFDFIFMVELIEHIEDPIALLSACRSVLAHHGVIFLTTPSGQLRNGSNRTAAYAVPMHIQFFTQKSLRLAAKKAGFSSVEYIEMREFHAGSDVRLFKLIKDYARMLRNLVQGKHHLIAVIK